MNDPRHPTQPLHPPVSHPHAPTVPQPPRAPAPHPPPPRPIVQPAAPTARPGIAPVPAMRPPADDLEPIELIEEEDPTPPAGAVPLPHQQPVKKIKAFGVDEHKAHHDWKRQPMKTGAGACRVRSFHGKYSEQGLEYLDNAINEWLDGHPEIEVKFVTSTVMTFEGKVREPALVLNVWY